MLVASGVALFSHTNIKINLPEYVTSSSHNIEVSGLLQLLIFLEIYPVGTQIRPI
jgi:hypothetical protein